VYENKRVLENWDVLRLIIAINRHGGVSGAGRELGVTHATISRRLAKAEHIAGVAFFDRLPSGLKPTQAGNAILEAAYKIEPKVNDLERLLFKQDESLKGPLRVTIPPLMMTVNMAQIIKSFTHTHPQVRLDLVGDNALFNLHQREADIAIRVSKKPPETLWGRKLTDQVAGYYAQTQWLTQSKLAHGDLNTPLPLISFRNWNGEIPLSLKKHCPNIVITAHSNDMVIAARLVQAGIGIACIPKIIGDGLTGVSQIKALGWDAYSPLWILAHPDHRNVPKVLAFMQLLGQEISKLKQNYGSISHRK